MSAVGEPSFAGHRAVITGAGRGIGRAIALDLLARGADVLAIARSGSDLESLADEGRHVRAGAQTKSGMSSGRIETAAVDVRDAPGLEEAIGSAGADLLITAAGTNVPGPLVEAKLEDLSAILDINVTGTLLACRAFGRAALAAGRAGAVVTMSSQMGVVGYPGRVAYCASKHAVNGLTKALALEWARSGIRVNAVAPTFVRTPLTAPMFEDPLFEQDVLARIPLGVIGEVQDVTGAVRFLLSSEARMITGHVLAVDGGWTVQ
jgi:NAD(P)-dependent dehydrogenase (short-subunit alcohol dehydrogenase family)